MLTEISPSLPPAYTLPVQKHTRHRLPAVLMRSGTSKGLFLHRQNLPQSVSEWPAVILAAMGSRDSDLRQLDGLGGGSSTTSKVIVVSKSDRPDIDIEYTFVQVAVGKAVIDMTGNCGNMSAGVAPFALDEGLIRARPGETELSVRLYNTNTKTVIVETIQVTPDGYFQDEGDYKISGVNSSGSVIKMKFEEPAGSMTGKLLPTGKAQDSFLVPNPALNNTPWEVRATLLDAGNPFVLVDSRTLPPQYDFANPDSPISLDIAEAIRKEGAVHFGLARSTEQAALVRGTPKIAILSAPKVVSDGPLSESLGKTNMPDIDVLAYSMGKVHPSLQLTGAVCIGAAVSVKGTVAQELSQQRSDRALTPPGTPPDGEQVGSIGMDGKAVVQKKVVIKHRSGIMDAEVETIGEDHVKSVTVLRTARRLFEGTAVFNL